MKAFPLTAGVVLALSGCALHEPMADFATRAHDKHDRLAARHQAFFGAAADEKVRRRRQTVDRPWIAGHSQPLARDVTLPAALRKDVPVTLLFADGALSLPQIAERITRATDIPAHVRAEALLPADQFMSRLQTTAKATHTATDTVLLAGEAEPLARILDRVAASLSVEWAYRNDRIEFYRTETRVFNVRSLTLEARAEASLGQRQDSGHSDGFASTSQTSFHSSSEELFDTIRARIEPFLSRAGVLVAQAGASGSIVVTDTPEVLDRIAAYLDRENQILTRRIRLVFEEITLATHDTAEAGLDWDLIFSSARVAAQASMGGAGLVDAGLATAQVATGPMRGSEAIVEALAQSGRIVRRSSMPVLTLNKRPVTHAVRSTFSYIDKVDTTTYNDGTGHAVPAVSVSQKEETVGSLLTLLPDAQDDGRILLSVAYDNTVAQPLKSIKFGDRDHPLQLQQITIDGNGTVQQLMLQPGQPLLVSGFDRSEEESEGKRAGPGMPMLFGGGDRLSREQLVTVIIITAQMEEGI